MTYCVGLQIDQGLAFMSDTRTNAGVDNISTFRKMRIWEEPGERVIVLMSSGNLATTQSVVSLARRAFQGRVGTRADLAGNAVDVPDGPARR
jgi:predicted proteasome-type protease